MLITSYKIGGVHFRLLGTNGFHVKAKNERFTATSSRCRQNLKYENFTSSFGSLRQNIAPESVPHVQHDHFSSFNQWNHWFEALSLRFPSSNLKLPNRELKQPRRRRQKKTINLHIWQWKTVFLHALHEHVSPFDILQTFSFFLRREMTSFAVVWTTWAYDDKSLVPIEFQLNSRIVRTRFSSIMTLNNWKRIAV